MPLAGRFSAPVYGSGTAPVQLELLNTLGQVMLKRSAPPRAGILREEFDLTNLATGVYSVRVRTSQSTVAKRLTASS